MNAQVKFQTINCRVTAKMYEALAKKAQAANLSTTGYVTNLLLAAYAAKCGPTGDKAMEDAVNGAVMQMSEAAEIGALKLRIQTLEAAATKGAEKATRLEASLSEAYAESDRLDVALKAKNEKAAKPAPMPVSADVLVKAVVIGFGTGLDSKQIADRIGLSEPFVTKTLDAWREELRERAAA